MRASAVGAIAAHYGRGGLAQAIEDGLRAAGVDSPSIDDLASVDDFHIGGKRATVELAELVAPERGALVADLGGGLGGPARTLAATFGCRVAVLDLTEEYWRERLEVARSRPPRGVHLLLGSRAAEIGENTMRNLAEGRIAVIQAVFDRS